MAKKVSVCGLCLALAMILSYLEHLLSLDFIAPGVKLGLANCVFLVLLLLADFRTALMINLGRIFLSAFLFGNPISLIFSLSGGAFSMAAAFLFQKLHLLSPAGIGAVCGVVHNLVQLVAAWLVIGSAGVFFYAPILLLSGVICGTITGSVSAAVAKHTENLFKPE